MKRFPRSVVIWALAAPLALALSGCGSGSERADVSVDDLPSGSYVVSAGNPDAPTPGRYYAGADGSRLLVLQDNSEQVSQIYRRDMAGTWDSVPPTDVDVQVSLLHSSDNLGALPSIDLASLQGSYVVPIRGGAMASFSVTADGRILPGNSTCRRSGTVGHKASSLPGTLALSLNSGNCDSELPVSSSGVLIVDREDTPAAFRLVADDGARLLDLVAFTE